MYIIIYIIVYRIFFYIFLKHNFFCSDSVPTIFQRRATSARSPLWTAVAPWGLAAPRHPRSRCRPRDEAPPAWNSTSVLVIWDVKKKNKHVFIGILNHPKKIMNITKYMLRRKGFEWQIHSNRLRHQMTKKFIPMELNHQEWNTVLIKNSLHWHFRRRPKQKRNKTKHIYSMYIYIYK